MNGFFCRMGAAAVNERRAGDPQRRKTASNALSSRRDGEWFVIASEIIPRPKRASVNHAMGSDEAILD